MDKVIKYFCIVVVSIFFGYLWHLYVATDRSAEKFHQGKQAAIKAIWHEVEDKKIFHIKVDGNRYLKFIPRKDKAVNVVAMGGG